MKLLDSLSVHYMPFLLPEGGQWLGRLQASPLWQHQDIHVESDVLHDHVAQFLNSVQLEEHSEGCVIFSFQPKGKSPLSALFNARECVVNLKDSSDVKLDFRFTFCKGNKLDAPRLLLYPNAGVGFLSLGVELKGADLTLENLLDFNYGLHKTDQQSPLIQMPFDRSKFKPKNEGDLPPDLRLYRALNGSEQGEGFYLYQLRDFLLSDFGEGEIRFLNPARTHVFSFVRLDEVNDSEAFSRNYVRLLRGQNGKYAVSLAEQDSGITRQSFENIHFGSCVEGGGIAVVAPEGAPEVLKNFKTGSLLPRYLWIYVLVLVQRYTLYALTAKLTIINLNRPKTSEELTALVEQLSRIQVNTNFADISDYTQHNVFYKLCCRNLSILEYYEGVSSKLNLLTDTLSRRYHAAEEKHHRVEEDMSRRLNVGVAILTIAQIFFAAVQFFFDGMHVSLFWWWEIFVGLLTLYFVVEAGRLYWNVKKSRDLE